MLPFYRLRNRGTERWSYFSNITAVIRYRMGIQIQGFKLQRFSSASCFTAKRQRGKKSSKRAQSRIQISWIWEFFLDMCPFEVSSPPILSQMARPGTFVHHLCLIPKCLCSTAHFWNLSHSQPFCYLHIWKVFKPNRQALERVGTPAESLKAIPYVSF